MEEPAAAAGGRLILVQFQDDLDALFATAVREGASVGHLLSLGGHQGRQRVELERLLERLGRRATAEAVALMTPLDVVVLQEPIEVTLNLRRLKGRLPNLYAKAGH